MTTDRGEPPPVRGAQRVAVVERVADAVPRLPGRRVRVGVDGIDGAGKTWFADDVARVLTRRGIAVQRLSIDDFLAPAIVRYARGRRSPVGYWLDSHDLPRFVRAVTAEPAGGPPGVVVVDGIFLHRDELVDLWDLRLFLDVAPELGFARMARRDGRSADPAAKENVRYSEGQKLYLAACDPPSRAHLVVDNTDVTTPTLVRRRTPLDPPTPAERAEPGAGDSGGA
jgi:uridine kinase